MKSLGKYIIVDDFFLRSWRPFIWLAFVASLPYLQVLTFSEYTHYDDYFLIVENFSHINKLSHVVHAFLEDVSHQAQGGNLYRPIMTISLILNSQISGTLPFGYHLIDIIFHCTSCCLLFVTLQMLGFKRSISFLGSLVFCVHPALSQTVAWIPGRNDSLLAVFILLCFISFAKFLLTSRLRWYFLHLLFFSLAMFTKETSIVFPALAMVYCYNIMGKKTISLTTVLFFVGWGLVLFDWYILRTAAMITPVEDKFKAAVLVLSNLSIALYYLGNIFWPFNLAFAPISTDTHIIAGIISAGLFFLAILFSKRRDWKLIIFGVIWFIAFLIPTFYYDLAVHPPQKFFDHRIYIPFMGIVFVLLSLSYTINLGYLKRLLFLTFLFVFIFLGWLSYVCTFNFKDSLTLSEYDATTSPNDPRQYREITRMNVPKKLDYEMNVIKMESSLQGINRTVISKEELWKIINDLKGQLKSNHKDPELHHALAIAYFACGLFLSSEENFFAAIRGNPQDAVIPYNLGILYYTAHLKIKAERAWQESLQLNPAMGDAHLNLSFIYYESGQYYSAWDHCQQAMLLGITIPPSFIDEIRKKIS